ncbi:hypothetical protein HK105_206412 [Polyrhizophydium stewartii]|uniref:Ankyrin repeat protein n=1 Tax=Polyrhizophydium stewartii TaxID=2732419 RepID=A0ABR4N3T9_9FUNG|nr:hypothetical protein HK105_007988 [Polyrhizophydium stewartii]
MTTQAAGAAQTGAPAAQTAQAMPAAAAMQNEAILCRMLIATDTPWTLAQVNRAARRASAASGASGRGDEWRAAWLLRRRDLLGEWAKGVCARYVAPASKVDWLTCIAPKSKQHQIQRHVSEKSRTGSNSSCNSGSGGGGGGSGTLAPTNPPVSPVAVAAVSRFLRGSAGVSAAVVAAACRRVGSRSGSPSEVALSRIHEALWVLLATEGRVGQLRAMLDSPAGAPLAGSVEMLKPAAFASLQFSDAADTALFERVMAAIPNPADALRDLHFFACRLGRLAFLRILIEKYGYTLGQRTVALLNLAHQSKNQELVAYLLEQKPASDEVAEAVQAWKTIFAVHTLSSSAQDIAHIVDNIKTRMRNSLGAAPQSAAASASTAAGAASLGVPGGPPPGLGSIGHSSSFSALGSASRIEIMGSHWRALLEIACGKGHEQLVTALLDMARDREFAVFRLEITLKMLALAVDGEFTAIADSLLDSIPPDYGCLPRGSIQIGGTSLASPRSTSTAPGSVAATTESNSARVAAEILGKLPQERGPRREELLYRYCATPDAKMFAALFPQYHPSELESWTEAVKVHRVDMITFLIASGRAVSGDAFKIRDDCIWAAFQAGFVDIAQVLRAAGGEFAWMEETNANAGRGAMEPQAAEQQQLLTPRVMTTAAMAVFGAYGGKTDGIEMRSQNASATGSFTDETVAAGATTPRTAAAEAAGYFGAQPSSTDGGSPGSGNVGRSGGAAGGAGGGVRPGMAAARGFIISRQNSFDIANSFDKLAYTLSASMSSSVAMSQSSNNMAGGAGAAGAGPAGGTGGQRPGRSSSISSRDGHGVLGKRNSLLSRIVRGGNGMAQVSEDPGWNSFLKEGKFPTAAAAGDATTMLSWMEPKSLASTAPRVEPAMPVSVFVAEPEGSEPGAGQADMTDDAFAVYAALGGELY